MTFFGQHGVENFFSYFSLNVSSEIFKISHSKKISLEKNFYLKIAVSALSIVQRYSEKFQKIEKSSHGRIITIF